MILKNKLFIAAFLFIFFITHHSWADTFLKIATHKHVPPHIYQENGVAKGIDVDIIKELFARMGIHYQIEHYPWKRALENTKHGNSDMLFPAFKTEERETNWIGAGIQRRSGIR